MSLLKNLKLTRQGTALVLRDETGAPVRQATIKSVTGQPTEETWRSALRKLTRDGVDLMEILFDLAKGQPIVRRLQLPDGTWVQSEPIIPSPEVMRASAMDLKRMLHGKEVAETEVIKAEESAQKMKQLAAYSDDELLRMLKENKNYAEFLESPAPAALPEGEDE